MRHAVFPFERLKFCVKPNDALIQSKIIPAATLMIRGEASDCRKFCAELILRVASKMLITKNFLAPIF